MLKSYDYLASDTKLRFDAAAIRLIKPLVLATELAVRSYIGDGVDPIFRQLRTGQAGADFFIHKFLTLDPANGQPFNATAARIRKLGLDELAQNWNIQKGEMSVTGWRPQIPHEHDAFRDALGPKLRKKHDFVVAHSLPGDISSYGIYSHIRTEADPNDPEVRAEMNIQDATDASLINDFKLLNSLVGHAIGRRMR